ncbi:hypothetical protein FRC02_007944 [Tulasnella sp. 418]|nr:hypothetical protein FRC02_007944 [Tulasnella sp. 418]
MTTPAPPPILEIEDQPQSNRRPDYPPSEHLQSTPPPHTPHQEPETTLFQARDFPEPHINDHAAFWSTYNKEAEEYDAEMLKGWNNSLDVLLIFAGLFSAVNTAFIIESYKGLSPDPAETTNALLRLLIIHRSDNITLTSEDLNPGEVNSSAISVNYIFFASLYSSLSAAFGAVTAKQWLTEYSNKGPAKAPHVLGFQRTMKFKGLKEWHFQLLMDLLPILLQLSLLLFLIGVVEFLSVLDRKVGMMQLVLVVGGTAVYALTLIIGIIYPTSPFRTPVINYIRGIVKFCIDHSLFIAAIIKLVGSIKKKRLRFTLFMLLETLLSPIADCFIVIAVLWKYAWPGSQASKRGGEPRWNDDEQRAAESVIWLLENSEHPDTTVVTLDAARRLHPDLMSSMIAQQQGLSERLEKFCASMLPQGSEGRLQWFEELSDGAVVSLIAWRHIHPNLRFPFTKSPENLYQYPIVIDNTPKGYSLAIRILVAHNIGARFISEKASLWGSEFSSGGAERRSSWLISPSTFIPKLIKLILGLTMGWAHQSLPLFPYHYLCPN